MSDSSNMFGEDQSERMILCTKYYDMLGSKGKDKVIQNNHLIVNNGKSGRLQLVIPKEDGSTMNWKRIIFSWIYSSPTIIGAICRETRYSRHIEGSL